ncbi:MAG: metalloregulator ArsR/SmtB family transcription factor [Euryarchaeota archaeon]|nr:metalloregulator ArsR/SmtB family transcription factor [Euryarchaeota archaeon]
MLESLRQGERSVSELVEAVDIHQPGVSRHLKILHSAGLVDVRKDGQRRIYSLRPEPLKAIDDWLDDYRALWDERFDRLEAHLRRLKEEREDEARQDRLDDPTRST